MWIIFIFILPAIIGIICTLIASELFIQINRKELVVFSAASLIPILGYFGIFILLIGILCSYPSEFRKNKFTEWLNNKDHD
jgi:hypothetical protein